MIASTFQALIVPSAARPSSSAAANAANDQALQAWRTGRRSEAVTQLNAATRADPRFAVPWHNRGTIFLLEGQFQRAIPALVHAAEAAPDWTLPRVYLAQAYLRAGDATSALAVSDAVRMLDPTLPDVRADLMTLLRTRAQIATAVAARRRNYFVITLVVAIFITLATAFVGFATLALPIYRFTLYTQARRARNAATEQLKLLEASPPPVLPARPLPTVAPAPAPGSSGAYVSAGVLPPFAAAELDGSPNDSRFRRTGWRLLLSSTATLTAAVGALLVMQVSLPPPARADLNQFTDAGLLFVLFAGFLGVTGLLVLIALIVGCVAATRRHRFGWALAIAVIGGIGLLVFILPGMVMVLIYLLGMPTSGAERGLEFIPVPQVSLGGPAGR
ncbi:MAG TPA: tetratricopeptide repeat protein [Ktedonobacterales bacterium]|nr:tetratricopeptide repeat protein [Ktedonobacterales bacterium]